MSGGGRISPCAIYPVDTDPADVMALSTELKQKVIDKAVRSDFRYAVMYPVSFLSASSSYKSYSLLRTCLIYVSTTAHRV